ncbi:hypothetical protein ACLQ3B_03780 [Micromonospora sp. DT53]
MNTAASGAPAAASDRAAASSPPAAGSASASLPRPTSRAATRSSSAIFSWMRTVWPPRRQWTDPG